NDLNAYEDGVGMQEQGFWLSPQQKFVWTIEQDILCTASRSACLICLDGPLNVDRLREGLRDLVNRHEILRTVFRRQTGMKVPFQVVLESGDFGWEQTELSGVSKGECDSRIDSAFQASQSFAGSTETGPVLNAHLLTVTSDTSYLVLSVPSLCADHHSL